MYWIYGRHAVESALKNQSRHVAHVIALKPDEDLENAVELRRKTSFALKDQGYFQKLFGPDAVHQGVAAQVEALSYGSLEDFIDDCDADDKALFVMLDQITDPHNVGAILRSAAAFGVKSVIHAKHQSAPLDSAIIAKTACGGVEHVAQHTVTNFAQTMKLFKDKGYWIIGLDERGECTIEKAPLVGKIVFMMGAEGKGLRRLTKDNCDVLTKLPTHPEFPTLNVSNAAVLSFYEYARQNKT